MATHRCSLDLQRLQAGIGLLPRCSRPRRHPDPVRRRGCMPRPRAPVQLRSRVHPCHRSKYANWLEHTAGVEPAQGLPTALRSLPPVRHLPSTPLRCPTWGAWPSVACKPCTPLRPQREQRHHPLCLLQARPQAQSLSPRGSGATPKLLPDSAFLTAAWASSIRTRIHPGV